MMGVPKYLVDREAALLVEFEDPRENMLIKGKTIRAEEVEGRKDLIALGLVFDQTTVPMTYKMRINDYLSFVRADTRTQDAQQQDSETNEE